MSELILEVKELKKYFPITKGAQRGLTVKAIDGISFTINKGETLGLVGESGSGKSTTAYNVIGLYNLTGGEMYFEGEDITMDAKKRPLHLKKKIQIVFQDPGTTLNPQRTVKQILSLPLKIHGMYERAQGDAKIIELLKSVELSPEYLYKYPSSLGGGERQMVAIARAIATEPSLIILDEPTSSLDVSVQAKIINMLLRLQKQRDLSYLFITHDLSLMRNFASKVAIMYLGKITEIAPTDTFFEEPSHPYTQMLLSAVPVISEEEEALKGKKVIPTGEIPSPVNVPKGCPFCTRCPYVMDKCKEKPPIMRKIGEEHYVACYLRD